MPLPLACGLYGLLLGLGFTTFVLSFAVWALAGISFAGDSVALGIVIVVIAAGVGGFFLTRGDPASVSYRTGVATLGTVTQTVSLSGNRAPDGETDLDFEGPGKVTAVNVQPGQTVTTGETLATQDPTTVDASLTQADATLSAAQANLTSAEAGSPRSSTGANVVLKPNALTPRATNSPCSRISAGFCGGCPGACPEFVEGSRF